jgi:hypothetical protein
MRGLHHRNHYPKNDPMTHLRYSPPLIIFLSFVRANAMKKHEQYTYQLLPSPQIIHIHQLFVNYCHFPNCCQSPHLLFFTWYHYPMNHSLYLKLNYFAGIYLDFLSYFYNSSYKYLRYSHFDDYSMVF